MDDSTQVTIEQGYSSLDIPRWLKPLIHNIDHITDACHRYLSNELITFITQMNTTARHTSPVRKAAVLVLFSGPPTTSLTPPQNADLLLTVRAPTLRHHGGQVAFPGGAHDHDDTDMIATALREAHEETGITLKGIHPFATLPETFISPSQFHVIPVIAYTQDPGPVRIVNPAETSFVGRIPLTEFIDPTHRYMVYRPGTDPHWAMPAFRLKQMLVWGFTAQIISSILEVTGWVQPWNYTLSYSLDEVMNLSWSPLKEN